MNIELSTNAIAMLTIFVALIGPILAVQTQKWIERARERRGSKEQVFQLLMSTRATRLSADHVRALNMIDFTFREPTKKTQVSKNRKVLDCWHLYIDHLNQRPGNNANEDGTRRWADRGNDLFIDMLEAMAKALGYEFSRVTLNRHGYTPVAHGNLELQAEAYRAQILSVLSGNTALKMEITNIPAGNGNNHQ